ncbi:MAG TPA: nickel pincer cofactor biosynthesis protein LarC [bacterium]|nr:nickel pincer cofactor biosynthesis protein LarC [bacterium]
MRILYLDLVGGISGDMLVGALVDLGVPLELLRERVRQAGLEQVSLACTREQRHRIAGMRFQVGASEPVGGGLRDPLRPFALPSAHAPRAYRGIRAQLEDSALPADCRALALRVFEELARAEGAVHDVAPEQVLFHEVGAWDSIADTVCAAAGIAHLGPEAIYCSPVPLGGGSVRTAHGSMPVPAPATLRLLQGFPVQQGGPAYERTTPTGAAILAALAQPRPDPLAYVPERVGIGLGTADPPQVANLLRAVLGRAASSSGTAMAGTGTDWVELAAANLDDANPEWIGFAMERLLALGALDVALLPLQMKKGRPGTQIQVLYPPALREPVLQVLLTEVSTLGVRFQSWERRVLAREARTVRTPWGEVQGKVAHLGTARRFAPEFESCRALALQHGIPLPDVYQAAQRAYERQSTPAPAGPAGAR